jgi:cytochrome c-type biogenesis protein CcmH/NrfG
MVTPRATRSLGSASDATSRILVVAVVCLAAGLGIGYYFGKNIGNAAPAAVTVGVAAGQGQSPLMDPATFLADEASMKSMLSSNPKDLNTLIQLGNLYYDNNKFSQAVEYYGKALEIDPANINVRTDRGSCLWSLGQADAAIAEFRKSLETDPSHAQTLFNLGIVYLHGKNDMAEARKAWEKLLATNPDYPQRARIQEMLVSMGAPSAAAAGSPSSPGATGQKNAGPSSMEDLFKKMKK